MAVSGNNVQLSFTAPASRNYSIVSSTDVTQRGTNVVSGAMGTGGSAGCIFSGGIPNTHGYYYTVRLYREDPSEFTIP
jgi:hypothetical protein